MAVERGFRRLTIVVSITVLCVSLLPTPFLAYTLWLENRYDQSGNRCPGECSTDGTAHAIDLLVGVLQIFGVPLSSRDFVSSASVIGVLFVVNLAVSLVLAAIPWGVFYLLRWIAHGFGD